MFWTDQNGRAFLLKHYPSLVRTFDSYTHPVQRADALRYAVLHHYGGIYLDMVSNQISNPAIEEGLLKEVTTS
jgi:inositol phosphorylceramide mannosyltransferase catalytic subunit